MKSLLEHAKFCEDESVEKDCYAIKDPTEHVETLGARITDATLRSHDVHAPKHPYRCSSRTAA